MRAVTEDDVGLGAGSTEFEPFFERESERLFQAMFLATGSRAEAEDLCQEAMARAFERWDRIRRMESPAGYVYRTAFNLHRKRLRRLGRAQRAPDAPPSPPADPGSVAEVRDQILRALRSLSPTQVEALLLVEWLGMTADEAGRSLGIEASSVRGRVHRARTALRHQMGDTDA
jgi:RNA polymerase sigma-70 factor (ECF subfamily)